ncbi:Proline-specific permease [Colletotrichum shisoi]|uniref:Proline-specific permease n=1 Tax=Colletotrichum shisoi TaxID=2078593 RepID=A0A5Q4BN53_9PEZI|nr:Proline-specific permease [Colletotrichum shisoi]
MSISVAAEISAAATLIHFWSTSVNPGVWITVFLVFIVTVNFCGARLYDQTEVVFASLMIMTIVGLIIGGLVIDLGGGPHGERIGFRYWQNPGAFNSYLVPGYGNIQVVAIYGSETREPRKIIPAATRKTFFRVFFFYVLSILVQSPFVIAFTRSGVSVLPSIINAVVCTSAISSDSACVFIASRTLYGLSCDGHAPKILQRCNRFGTPHYAVELTCALTPLVYLNVANNTSVVFGWFVNITTVAGLIGWMVIEVTYLRFYAGLKAQGYSLNGFDVFTTGNFTASASGFLTCYVNVFVFAALYLLFKFYLKSRVIAVSEMDFGTEFTSIRQEKAREEVYEHKETGLKQLLRKIVHTA